MSDLSFITKTSPLTRKCCTVNAFAQFYRFTPRIYRFTPRIFIASRHGFLRHHTTDFYCVTPRIFIASHHGLHSVTPRIFIASHHRILLRHTTDFFRVAPAMRKDLGFEVSSELRPHSLVALCYKQGGLRGIRLLYPESAIHREDKLKIM